MVGGHRGAVERDDLAVGAGVVVEDVADDPGRVRDVVCDQILAGRGGQPEPGGVDLGEGDAAILDDRRVRDALE